MQDVPTAVCMQTLKQPDTPNYEVSIATKRLASTLGWDFAEVNNDYDYSLYEYGLAGQLRAYRSLVPNCTALELQLHQLGLVNDTSHATSNDTSDYESDAAESAPLDDLLSGCTSASVKTVASLDDVNEELYCTASKNTVRLYSTPVQNLRCRVAPGGGTGLHPTPLAIVQICNVLYLGNGPNAGRVKCGALVWRRSMGRALWIDAPVPLLPLASGGPAGQTPQPTGHQHHTAHFIPSCVRTSLFKMKWLLCVAQEKVCGPGRRYYASAFDWRRSDAGSLQLDLFTHNERYSLSMISVAKNIDRAHSKYHPKPLLPALSSKLP